MTVKANELRIGNLVQQDDGKVYSIKASQLHNNEVLGRCPIQINPIPITEGWLLRFGFELELKEGNQNEYRVYSFNQITYNTNHGWWWKKCHLEVQPNNIHQLQNLYFALTGKELKINKEII
jgi:hypothetical protein